MNYIHHMGSMGDLLEMPGRQGGQPPVLNWDLKPARLEALYGELAKIVLLLSTPTLSRIRSVTKNDNSTWEVLHRPLSYSMNETAQLGTVHRSEIPTTTYGKASMYFEALAELHLIHLRSQTNEANIDADVLAHDFRRKFVPRFLFRKLVRDQEQRKQWIFHDDSPFPVWCDDFRPENVLVDEAECIAGVVDWEFTYTALLNFLTRCLGGFSSKSWKIGLKALITDEVIQKRLLVEDQRLSSRMPDSWQNGDFWIMYAARNNFAFGTISWKVIDQRFFGPTIYEDDNICSIWRRRLHLLQPEEKSIMEEYVNLKLKDRNTWRLVWDPDEYAVGWIKRLKIKKE
ncbi:hypothetical protein BDV24DRAFT_164064 [Aspergillus arachidicola]|uniref:Aminoglycoside phosphotransferase domain-containing protein n=1 Tax=Aspergillus arachidicola TaxID=656916 RepID=A0A5N6Y5V6_9EURO|nr:hypothetical protein BDV24DRAFT_164064 [Aspergillus arachidicola]